MRVSILSLVTALFLWGCGGSPYARSGAGIQSLAAQVERQANRSNHEIRWNPGMCDCSPYEIRLGDRWSRVLVEPPGEATELKPQSRTKAFMVRARCSELLYPCGDTQICPQLTILPAPPGNTDQPPSP